MSFLFIRGRPSVPDTWTNYEKNHHCTDRVVCVLPGFAGAYVETREAYNTASELHEVILRAGYNFDMGTGLMFTNAYNVGNGTN